MATHHETYSPFDPHIDVDCTGEVVVPHDFAQFLRLHPGALDWELRQDHSYFSPKAIAFKDAQGDLPADQQTKYTQLDAIATREAIQFAEDATGEMRRHSIETRDGADVDLEKSAGEVRRRVSVALSIHLLR